VQDTRKLGALLVALVIVMWLPALWGGFVWDDINNLVTTDRLRHWSSLIESFRHNAMWSAERAQPVIGTYRPLSLASFVIDFQLYGRNPTGFHFSSLVLHATATLALFGFLLRWVATPLTAAAIALLWAVHPVDVEAVAWINGRSEILALLFGVLALRVVSVERLGPGRVLGAGALLLLAMLGKESGLVFAPLAVMFASEATGIAGPGRAPWRRIHWPVVGTAVLAVLAYGYLRQGAMEGGVAAGLDNEGASTFVTALRALPAVWLRSIQTVALPLERGVQNLHLWLQSLPTMELAGYIAASVGIVAIALWLWWRERRVAVYGLLWWLGSLTPIALIAVRDWPGFYRWLYIGLPGFILFVYLGFLANVRLRARQATFAAALVPALALTWRGIPAWWNDGNLFQAMIEENPKEPFGYSGYGAWLLREGRYDDAAVVLEESIKLGGTRPDNYLFLGMAHTERGRCAEGVQLARDHVQIDEVPAWFLLSAGGCFAKKGDDGNARTMYAFCADENQSCATAIAALPSQAAPASERAPASGEAPASAAGP
jgi:hypothetical protein